MTVSIYDGFKLISEPYVVLAKRHASFTDTTFPMAIVANAEEAQELIKQFQRFETAYSADKMEYAYIKIKHVQRIADDSQTP